MPKGGNWMGWTSAIKEALAFGTGATGMLEGAVKAIGGLVQLTRKPDPDFDQIKAFASDAIDKLFEAKKAQMAMHEKLVELEQELRKRDRFHAEAERYALTKTEMGSLVYSLKPGDPRGEPAHDLCAACFEREVKAMLQPVDFNTLECPVCKARALKPDGRAIIMTGGGRGSRWDI